MRRPWLQSPLLLLFYEGLIVYKAPSNLTYFWNFGFLAGFALFVQIATGIFLAMHYVPDVHLAMDSVEHLMRDVQSGWILRYVHANGASLFFITVYVHIARGLYQFSYAYPRHHLWQVGVLIFLLMIVTAFLGYVLPWGQMSFWGATVITNLLSAIPYVGSDLVVWVWGGYAVDRPTLNRFFSLHFLLPFVILALVGVHVLELHTAGSNNPVGVPLPGAYVPFHPYYTLKDGFGIVVFLVCLGGLVFFTPNLLGHSDNYILANPLVTPAHIVPEWYFLPFYAILRSVPSKLGGVLAMLLSILVLLVLPYLISPHTRTVLYRPFSHFFFYLFCLDVFLLGYLGSCPAEAPYVLVSQFATFFYFSYFLLLTPIASFLDHRFGRLFS